jgi:hypothetical protein
MEVSDLELVAQGRLNLAEQEIHKARALLSRRDYMMADSCISSAITELYAARNAIDSLDSGHATEVDTKVEEQVDPTKPR